MKSKPVSMWGQKPCKNCGSYQHTFCSYNALYGYGGGSKKVKSAEFHFKPGKRYSIHTIEKGMKKR